MQRAIIIITFISLILCGVAQAQNPTLTFAVNKTPQSTTLTVQATGGSNNNLLQVLDLATLSWKLDDIEVFPTLLSLLGTPFVSVGFSPSFDTLTIVTFFDLTPWAHFWGGCLQSSYGSACFDNVVMIRDASCYPNAACTNGQREMTSWMGYGWGAFNQSAFKLVLSESKVIAKFTGVGDSGTQPNNPSWGYLTWYVNIWSSETRFAADPTRGDVVNRFLLSETHQNFNNDFYLTLIPNKGVPLILQPGTYWISVFAQGSMSGGTQWFWRHTTKDLGMSDIFTSDISPYQYFWYTYHFHYYPGGQGVDVYAY